MRAEETLHEIDGLVAQLVNKINCYNSEIKEAGNLVAHFDKVLFDFNHIVEDFELTPEESFNLTSKLNQLRVERRKAKRALCLNDFNRSHIFKIAEVLDKHSLTTTLPDKIYTMRTKEGEELLNTVKGFSVRSNISFSDIEGNPMQSSLKDIEEYLNKSNSMVELTLDKENNIVRSTASFGEENTSKLIELGESVKDLTDKDLRDESKTKEVNDSLNSIKGFVNNIKENTLYITRSNNLWVVKKLDTIVCKSSKISKILEYLYTSDLPVSIEPRYTFNFEEAVAKSKFKKDFRVAN